MAFSVALKLHANASKSDKMMSALGDGGNASDVLRVAEQEASQSTVVHLTATKSEMWGPEVVSYQQPPGTKFSQDTTVVLRPRTARHRITFKDTSFRTTGKKPGKRAPRPVRLRDMPSQEDFAKVCYVRVHYTSA